MTLKMRPVVWVVFLFINLFSVDFCLSETLTESDGSTVACGVLNFKAGLIVRGENFTRGDFPWIVALYLTKTNPPMFFCAGSVISSTFVISAAHCFNGKDENNTRLPRDVLAFFGAYDLNSLYEPDRYPLSPKKIILHEDWNPKTTQFDGDLSLLEFEKGSIHFNNFVQPICLWNSEEELPVLEGTVTGWGKSEDKTRNHENIPKLVEVSIYNNAQCLPGETSLAELSSQRTFCADSKKGSGVCFGDSGGGLFINVYGVLYLKGIVSSSSTIKSYNQTKCDISKSAVYTDVAQFTDWIREKTGLPLLFARHDGLLQSHSARDVPCWIEILRSNWIDRRQNLETCHPVISRVSSEDFTISPDEDPSIQAFSIQNKPGVKFLPTNLNSTFPHLVEMQARNCSVTVIENHFKGLSQLKVLDLGYNKIRKVSRTAFVDLIGLEYLNLANNKISFFWENTFDSLNELRELHLGSNNIYVLHFKILDSLANVEVIDLSHNDIFALDENIFQNTTSLKEIHLNGNKLERIPNNTFKHNFMLKQISFNDNKLRFINGSTFDHLPNLKIVDLRNNFCIDASYDRHFKTMRNTLNQACKESTNIQSENFTATCEIPCSIRNQSWENLVDQKQNIETCQLDVNIVDNENFKISSDTNPTTQAFSIRHKPGVKFLPTNLVSVLPKLVAINVLNCSVTFITNHFKGLFQLKTLILAHNKIENIAEDAFVDLIALEQLGLHHNRITSLEENIFDSLKELRWLFIGFNQIKFLASNIFGSLANIEWIDIQQNKISSLEENIIQNATGLKRLGLNGNILRKIPKNLFENNLMLDTIWLHINNIQFINGNIFDHLLSLNYVDLRQNICIDKSFYRNDFETMRNALEQSCDGNVQSKQATSTSETPTSAKYERTMLCTTSSILWEWNDRKQNMKTCYPDINKITYENITIPYVSDKMILGLSITHKKNVKYLPTSLVQTFPNLVAIQFYNCSVSMISGSHFKGFKKLKLLELPYNDIVHVEKDAFADLASLEKLDFSFNRIQCLENGTFDSLQELRDLLLLYNRIKILPHKVFHSLLRLEVINVGHNPISTFEENVFANANNLKTIAIEALKLETIIPKNLFKKNLKLEKVWLGYNKIKFIDANMFDDLLSLTYIDLQKNICIDKFYFQKDIEALKNDLKRSCRLNTSRKAKSALEDLGNRIDAGNITSHELALLISRRLITLG